MSMTDLSNTPSYNSQTCPNLGPELNSAIQQITTKLRDFVCQEQAALATWTNDQLAELNAIVSALTDVEDINAAVSALNSLQNIVDANGDGILDALGPLQGQIDSAVAAAQAAQTAAQGAQTAAAAAQQAAGQAQTDVAAAAAQASTNKSDIEELYEELENLDNQAGENFQALQDQWCAEKVALRTAIQSAVTQIDTILASGCPLPEKAITAQAGGGSGGSSGGSDDPDNL